MGKLKRMVLLSCQLQVYRYFLSSIKGFDCVPSDLAAYLLVKYFRDIGYGNIGKIHLGVAGMKGEISAGTVHSGLAMLDLPFEEKLKLFSQHYLIDGEIESKPGTDTFLNWNEPLQRWQVLI
jgi:hypothetical protein